ncbi:anti-sigma factor family protein [Paenibacillus sp. FA6]|uniref:anti-sigma factor family protein n=1 Tax=Paenibacillus sp. FA6 TaxID=3413029 RepID=UPI003F65B837
MKCCEAQELFGLIWDMPVDDPKRLMLEQHIATCSECSSEFELWEESRWFMQDLSDEWTELKSESINRQVMDRIFSESPWLIQDQSKPFEVPVATRQRLSVWIISCLMLFFISFLFFITLDPSKSKIETAPANGIFPTEIAGNSTVGTYIIPELNSGIIEPLVVNMGPANPLYWMVLSIMSVALALYSLRRLSRIRR